MFGFLTDPVFQASAQLLSAAALLACFIWVLAILGFAWLLMGRVGRDTLPTVAMCAGGLVAFLSFGIWVDLLVAVLRVLPEGWQTRGLLTMQVGSIVFTLAIFAFASARESALLDALRRRKGAAGEKQVSKRLSKLGYDHLDNLYVGDAQDVAQVDHIAKVGGLVLVIETKHLEGKLYPQSDGTLSQWFQDEKSPTTVPDPVRQNARQVSAVQRLAKGIEVKGVVVFTDRAEFPKGLPQGSVRLKDLGPYLRFITSSAPPTAATSKAWAELRAVLEALDQGDLGKRHIEMLADNAAFRSLPEGVTVCRKCQSANVKAAFGYSYHWRCDDCGGRSAMKAHEAEAMGISPDQTGVGGRPLAGVNEAVRQAERDPAGYKVVAPIVPRAPVNVRLPGKPQP